VSRILRSVEVRTASADGWGFTARALQYNVADSYGTVWAPGCATPALAAGDLPVLCFGHDWKDPIGRAVQWKDQPDGLYLQFRLDEDPAVPSAARVRAQLLSGTLTDVSVGFTRKGWREPTQAELQKWPGCAEVMTAAELDEVSVVVVGAVPGAEVLAGSVRSSVRPAPVDWKAREREVFRRALQSSGRLPATPAARESDPQIRALLHEADEALRVRRYQ
jgi:HK97 family phage prohead protease